MSQFINNQKRRKNKKLLGSLHNFPEETMSIGRLDENSEGLLLLTTDGKVSAEVRSKKVEKEYYVQVDGRITQEAIELLKSGVSISTANNKYKTLPCEAHILDSAPSLNTAPGRVRHERHGPTSWISITIREGKFRQVRKMTAVVGFPTLRLIRVRIGNVMLDQLSAGSVIEVEKFNL